MTQFDITTISDKELCDTGKRLQAAHDYIEVHGFDINIYGSPGMGACCYVGSVKVAADEDGSPRSSGKDGVIAALKLLDTHGDKYGESYAGGKIEARGFEDCGGKNATEQAEVALPVFRQALREVVNEMERRNDN